MEEDIENDIIDVDGEIIDEGQEPQIQPQGELERHREEVEDRGMEIPLDDNLPDYDVETGSDDEYEDEYDDEEEFALPDYDTELEMEWQRTLKTRSSIPFMLVRPVRHQPRSFEVCIHPRIYQGMLKMSILADNLWDKLYRKIDIETDILMGEVLAEMASTDVQELISGIPDEAIHEIMDIVQKHKQAEDEKVE